MGQGASTAKLPEVCERVSREQFQNKLMDIYAAYSLLGYYSNMIKKADLDDNGRPPKMLDADLPLNLEGNAINRIKKRAAKRLVKTKKQRVITVPTKKDDTADVVQVMDVDDPNADETDFKIYLWFNMFGEKYNNAEGDSARFQLLWDAIGQAEILMHYYINTLNEICENNDDDFYKPLFMRNSDIK